MFNMIYISCMNCSNRADVLFAVIRIFFFLHFWNERNNELLTGIYAPTNILLYNTWFGGGCVNHTDFLFTYLLLFVRTGNDFLIQNP